MDDPDHKLELHPPTLRTQNGDSKHTTHDEAATTSSAPNGSKSGPIPMSMPSILRNGPLTSSNHLSYLLDRQSGSSSYPPTRPKPRSHDSAGRRKQRRNENARLLSNPHAVRPTIKDYRLHSNEIKSTFPSFPSGKATSIPVPSSSKVTYSAPTHDPNSANQGHFGKSLRDAHAVLKRLDVGEINDKMVEEGKAGDLERFIWLVDREIRQWSGDEVFLFPSASDRKEGKVLLDQDFNFALNPQTIHLDDTRPGEAGQLIEFQRTPNALVWLVHDPFLRLVVHCLARVSKCPSFSKDDPNRGLRFTWVLNKNPLARKGRRGRRVSVSSSAISTPLPAVRTLAGALDTPPTTDFDSQTESEFAGDTDEGESLAGSTVLVKGEEREEGGEGTDEDEAEILRRVRRWAIDSHRQRDAADEAHEAEDEGEAEALKRKPKTRTSRLADADPDATLTGTIAEEDHEEDSS